MAKYYVLLAVVQQGQLMWLVIFALLMAAISVYYYFRVIIAMYFRDGATEPIRVAPFFQYVLLGAIIITLGLGIAPGLLQGLF